LHYATRTLSPVRLVLKVTLFLSPPEGGLDLVTNRQGFLLLHCTGVFLCFWGVLTRLDEITPTWVFGKIPLFVRHGNEAADRKYRARDLPIIKKP